MLLRLLCLGLQQGDLALLVIEFMIKLLPFFFKAGLRCRQIRLELVNLSLELLLDVYDVVLAALAGELLLQTFILRNGQLERLALGKKVAEQGLKLPFNVALAASERLRFFLQRVVVLAELHRNF